MGFTTRTLKKEGAGLTRHTRCRLYAWSYLFLRSSYKDTSIVLNVAIAFLTSNVPQDSISDY